MLLNASETHLKMSTAKLCLIVFLAVQLKLSSSLFDNEINLDCIGKRYENVTLTAYYPDYDDEALEEGFNDIRGKKLRTLQDFIDDRNQFVTLAMDKNLNITYGTPVCIPELNRHFGHRIRIQIRDTSSDLSGTGFSRADICVRSEIDSYDLTVNRQVTLVFESF